MCLLTVIEVTSKMRFCSSWASCGVLLFMAGCGPELTKQPRGGGEVVRRCLPGVDDGDARDPGYRALIPVLLINRKGPRLLSSLVLTIDVTLHTLDQSALVPARGAEAILEEARIVGACVVGPVYSDNVSLKVGLDRTIEPKTRLAETSAVGMVTELQSTLTLEVLARGSARVVDGVVTNHPNLREFVDFGAGIHGVEVLKYEVGDADGFNGFSFSVVVADAIIVSRPAAGTGAPASPK